MSITKRQLSSYDWLPALLFTAAALSAVVTVLFFLSACGTSSPAALPPVDTAYLGQVHTDVALAKFTDLDLMTAGHADCAEIAATNEDIPGSFNDGLDQQGFTSENDRMVLMSAAITHYCPRFSDMLEAGN